MFRLVEFLVCFGLFIHQPNDVEIVDKLTYLNQIGACFKLRSLERLVLVLFFILFFKVLYTSRDIMYGRTIV